MKLDARQVEGFLANPGVAKVVLLLGDDVGLIRERARRLVVTVAGAARLFGDFQEDTPLHPSTLVRWITRGVKLADGRRVRLEAARVGAKFVTSKEAVLRFVAAQTEAGNPTGADAPRTPAARTRASEKAAAELEAIGI